MRPLAIPLGPHGGGVDYELVVPERAVFHAAVGYWALAAVDHQYLHSPVGRIAASIRVGDGAFEELAAAEYDQKHWLGRAWTPLEVDLARFAGQRVTLRLALRAGPEIDPAYRMAWFGSPRITVPEAR
jgi:hypothetical protein